MAKSKKRVKKIVDIEVAQDLPKEEKIRKKSNYNSATEDFLIKHGLLKS